MTNRTDGLDAATDGAHTQCCDELAASLVTPSAEDVAKLVERGKAIADAIEDRFGGIEFETDGERFTVASHLKSVAAELLSLRRKVEETESLASPPPVAEGEAQPVAFVDQKGNLLIPDGSPLPEMLGMLSSDPFGEVQPLFTSPRPAVSEAMVARARELVNAFSIYTVEDDDGIRLSTGGHVVAHYGEHSAEGMALLKLEAHCRELRSALAASPQPSDTSEGGR